MLHMSVRGMQDFRYFLKEGERYCPDIHLMPQWTTEAIWTNSKREEVNGAGLAASFFVRRPLGIALARIGLKQPVRRQLCPPTPAHG